MSLQYEAMGAILSSLSLEKRATIKEITTLLLKLQLSQDSVDVILAALILEVAEKQFVDDGGAIPPERDSSVDAMKPLFDKKTTKSN